MSQHYATTLLNADAITMSIIWKQVLWLIINHKVVRLHIYHSAIYYTLIILSAGERIFTLDQHLAKLQATLFFHKVVKPQQNRN